MYAYFCSCGSLCPPHYQIKQRIEVQEDRWIDGLPDVEACRRLAPDGGDELRHNGGVLDGGVLGGVAVGEAVVGKVGLRVQEMAREGPL